jgi:hypothetical protein
MADSTLRQLLWVKEFGKNSRIQQECPTELCTNMINPWNSDVCHDIAKSKGGQLSVTNCRIMCHVCNMRQGTKTFEEHGVTMDTVKKLINGRPVKITHEEVDSDYGTESDPDSESESVESEYESD